LNDSMQTQRGRNQSLGRQWTLGGEGSLG
jgi:hypothetical protein